MSNDIDRELSARYCRRFGMIAVDKGFITAEKVKKAMSEQLDDDLSNRPHRLLGRILLENGGMTAQQIETVLNELFRSERAGDDIL